MFYTATVILQDDISDQFQTSRHDDLHEGAIGSITRDNSENATRHGTNRGLVSLIGFSTSEFYARIDQYGIIL
jgi:hypothetical protein